MRINIYAEEMTRFVAIVTSNPEGRDLVGVRIFLDSPPGLHQTALDDDRSAVTLWATLDETGGMRGDTLASLLGEASDKLWDVVGHRGA